MVATVSDARAYRLHTFLPFASWNSFPTYFGLSTRMLSHL